MTGHWRSARRSTDAPSKLDPKLARHLLDADDDMPQIDAIDLEIADSEWIDAQPGFSPQIHPFEQENAGIHFDDTDFTEFDYAAQFLNDDFWRLVVRETNIKAEQFFAAEPRLGPRSIFHNWQDVNTDEMKKFIGLILLMGLIKKARWRQYWSKDPLLSTPAFPAILDRNRYEMKMKFLHFSDNSMEPPTDSPMRDRIFKIRPLVNHLIGPTHRCKTSA